MVYVKNMISTKYEITNIDKLTGYFVDYLVYNLIYKALGLSTTFKTVNFTAADVVCYASTTRASGTVNGYNCSLTPLV